jgi:hypothetical protein
MGEKSLATFFGRDWNPRDWQEDAGHENGQYWCRCGSCGESFVGHKRRATCRECATISTPDAGGRDG